MCQQISSGTFTSYYRCQNRTRVYIVYRPGMIRYGVRQKYHNTMTNVQLVITLVHHTHSSVKEARGSKRFSMLPQLSVSVRAINLHVIGIYPDSARKGTYYCASKKKVRDFSASLLYLMGRSCRKGARQKRRTCKGMKLPYTFAQHNRANCCEIEEHSMCLINFNQIYKHNPFLFLQGYEHTVGDPSLLYRIETMPGLGW